MSLYVNAFRFNQQSNNYAKKLGSEAILRTHESASLFVIYNVLMELCLAYKLAEDKEAVPQLIINN
ncbi:MAG: hypothetical protein F6K24_14065 [Okeania sp. SIO2D1]|nr:hypothetical protein [Okeania sp. SIO2D1]